MAACTLLNLVLLLPFEHLSSQAWRLAAIAFAIQLLAAPFSLIAPVPINNRIIKWTPKSLPDDWRAQEHLLDVYHWVRTVALTVAFALLVASIGTR